MPAKAIKFLQRNEINGYKKSTQNGDETAHIPVVNIKQASKSMQRQLENI